MLILRKVAFPQTKASQQQSREEPRLWDLAVTVYSCDLECVVTLNVL